MTKTVEQIAEELKEKLKPLDPYKNSEGYRYYEDISGWYMGNYYHLVISQPLKGKVHIDIAHTTERPQVIKKIIKEISPIINIGGPYLYIEK